MSHQSCPQTLYKYFSNAGLHKTLERQSLKFSRATSFNDPIDAYIQEPLGMDDADFLKELRQVLLEFLCGDIDYDSLGEWVNKPMIIRINRKFKAANPEIKRQIKTTILATPLENIYDINRLRELNRNSVQILNGEFENYGIFCTSADCNNLLMWAHYAEQHRGAVVEFTPSVENDSVLLLSKPVRYTTDRPFLYKGPIDMVTRGLTKAPEGSGERIVERLVYTKSAEWRYEQEYRVHVPGLISSDIEYSTIPFHAKELTSLYFGCRMKVKERRQAVGLAKAMNPSVHVFEACIVPREFRLEYVRI